MTTFFLEDILMHHTHMYISLFNCRCLSDFHPGTLRQFSRFVTATTHSPCGRYLGFSFITFFSKLFPASIPHLLSHHTTGKRAASEHRSVQPKQGFYLMIILEDTLKKLSFRKLLLTSMFSSTHTSSVRTSEDVR